MIQYTIGYAIMEWDARWPFITVLIFSKIIIFWRQPSETFSSLNQLENNHLYFLSWVLHLDARQFKQFYCISIERCGKGKIYGLTWFWIGETSQRRAGPVFTLTLYSIWELFEVFANLALKKIFVCYHNYFWEINTKYFRELMGLVDPFK